MDLQNFIPILEGIRSQNPQAAENAFNELLNSNKCLLLHLLVLSITQIPDINTVKAAVILLQRVQGIISSSLPSLGDNDFHATLQNSLLQFFQTAITDHYTLKNLAHVISLFAGSYQQSWPNLYPTILMSLQSNSGPCMLLGTECLWKCIINGSIPIEHVCQTSFEFLNTLFSNPGSCDIQLILAAIRLAFFIHQKTNNNELTILSVKIINIYPSLPPEAGEEYLREIFYFVDMNIMYFSPSMSILFPLVMNIISDPNTPIVSRNHCINILNSIISDKEFSGFILPSFLAIFELLISTISKTMAESDEFGIEEKSLTQQVAEDAIISLSRVYSATNNIGYELMEVVENSSREDNPHLKRACLAAFACVAAGCEQIFGDHESMSDVLGICMGAIVCQDPATRYTAVKCLKKLLTIIGYYNDECFGQTIVPALIQVIAQETNSVVFTALIKCLTSYVSLFRDYEQFVSTVIGLIESKFGLMNAEQQIIAFRLYKSVFQKYPNEFGPFIEQIYGRMNLVLSTTNFHDNDSINLFFECMKIAPSFVGVPKEVYAETAGKILMFIVSVDSSNFSSYQLDCINYAIRTILRNCRQQFGPFAQKIVDITLKSAEKNIEVEFSHPHGCAMKDEDQVASLTAKFNIHTSAIDYYSDNDIDSVNEPLTTLITLLGEKELMAPRTMDVFRIINKILTEQISIKLILTTFNVAKKIIKYYDHNSQEGMNFSNQLLFLMINSFDIFESSDFDNITAAFRASKWLFIELSKSAANGNILQLVLIMIHNKYTFLHNIRLKIIDQIQSDLVDEYEPLSDVEKEIIWFFPPIFQYYAEFYEPFHQTMENTFVLEPLKNGTISTCAIHFWTYYCMFYANCPSDKFFQILGVFKTVATNGLQKKQYDCSTIKDAITAYTMLLSSEKLSVVDTLNEIPFITEFLYAGGFLAKNNNIFAVNNLILRPLLKIAAKLLTCQQDPAQIIKIIFDVIMSPLNYLYFDPFNDFAVMAFCVIVQANHPMLVTPEGMAIMLYIAIMLYDTTKTNELKHSIAMYVKTLLNLEQFSAVKDVIETKFSNRNQKHISKIITRIMSKKQ